MRRRQTAGGRGGPGYGESLSCLSVDLRMVINYSINSDQTQEEEVCPVSTMMVSGNPKKYSDIIAGCVLMQVSARQGDWCQ